MKEGGLERIAEQLSRQAARIGEQERLQEREAGPYLPSYLSRERLYEAERLKRALLVEFAGASLEELYSCAEVETELGPALRLEEFVPQSVALFDREGSYRLLTSQLQLLYGIGPTIAKALQERGYRTLEDLVAHPRFGAEASQLLQALRRRDLARLKAEVERWFCPSHPLTLALTGLVERLAFFDLESLGLFGRPLVLLGLARPVDGGLKIEQYVIRSIVEERAALAAASEALGEADAIVTYNGRAFDINYLEERLSYYGLYREIDRPNFDLLYPARRCFREVLPDCRLETVERHVLGIERPFDLPSALVPDFYNTYLEERNIGPLVAIIEHNKQDLVSLAALLSRLCSEFERW
ncbi:MAG: ribonuclease H-like domain-containing protein [Candidatus Bipolaricaulia bacterium]